MRGTISGVPININDSDYSSFGNIIWVPPPPMYGSYHLIPKKEPHHLLLIPMHT